MNMSVKEYVEHFMADVVAKNPNELEFHQAVREVVESVAPYVLENPQLVKMKVLERIAEPERVVMFRVPWVNDAGEIMINKGYRVQMNSAIGPYKGGIRFHSSVNLSILKFLAFEQTFKNALTTLPMGGGKGGSDFNPKGKSDMEIMRFCQSFMTALYRYIGPDIDVPAGDMGVGGREIGYLYGQYRRLKGVWENGVLTGKGFSYGGSLTRPEATGYGAMYYLQEVLKHEGEDIKGKTIACAGFGNVTWGICKKAHHLGAKVVTLSGPDGYVYDPDGVSSSMEKVDYLVTMRNSGRNKVKDYADKFGVEFHPGEKPWGVKADVIMPSAMQNDVHMEHAKQIAANGVANNLDSVGILIGNAVNLAMITVIGQCVGAGDEKQVRFYTKRLLAITYIPTVLLNLVLFLNLDWILGLYGLSVETTNLARTLIFIHNGCACLLWPLSFTFPNMLRACNDVRYTMIVSIASMFIFRIGFSYLIGVQMGYGAIGVWIAMVLDWCCRIVCFITRYLHGKWRTMAGLTAAAPPSPR